MKKMKQKNKEAQEQDKNIPANRAEDYMNAENPEGEDGENGETENETEQIGE